MPTITTPERAIRRVHAFCAQDIEGNPPVPLTILTLETPIPACSIREGEDHFRADAAAIDQALHQALPGGTLDALRVALLRRACGGLLVSHADVHARQERLIGGYRQGVAHGLRLRLRLEYAAPSAAFLNELEAFLTELAGP